jgi:adenylate kinase
VNLLVLGPQGSGKGTQARRISAAHGVPHISTGDMFRAAISAGTELGRRVEPILGSGDLVPDDLTVALIRERLSEPDAIEGFVLDGFPRNLAQAEALDEVLVEIDRPCVLSSRPPTSSRSSGSADARSTRRDDDSRYDRAPARDLPIRQSPW